MPKPLILFAILSAIGFSLQAQDGHYWTQHYGTRSILLSNSNIGGVDDLGALYYNPGRLALIENPAFLLNADVYEYSRISFKDAVGDGASRSTSDFGGVPGYAAGTFKVGFLKGHYFGYSILMRNRANINFGYRDEVFDDVLENFPGEEYFGANLRFNSKAEEQWYSLTWSYPFSDKLSLGVTTTASRVKLQKGTFIELQALTDAGQVAQYQFDRNYSIQQFGLLWKAGLAGKAEHFDWGITVTTPMLRISGKGSYNYEEFFSGIEGQSETEDIFTSSRQGDLDATYKRPFSLGGGLSFPLNRSELHVSSEWYSRVSAYTLLEANPHTSQSSGDTTRFTLIDDLRNVINAGIGTQIYFSDKVSGYASFSTDFSAAPESTTGFSSNEAVANNTVFSANFYHYAAGIVLTYPKAELTLGAAYTSAKQTFRRPVDFPEEGDDGIFDRDEEGTFRWDRIRIVFSFSFPFIDDVNKRLKGEKEEDSK